jgi:hypothetical protein
MYGFLSHLKRRFSNNSEGHKETRQALIERALKTQKQQTKLLNNLSEYNKKRLRSAAMEKLFKD